jgi:CubicO group peptidase (beta-lactamase class C family)
MAGDCDLRFAPVRDAFEGNFNAGLEAGAACAVVVDGDLVVDLWGGSADVETRRPWERDTLVDCRSATKGLTALCLAQLVDQALVDFDAPVRRYWPELRIDPTVRQALSHQAGIPIVDDLPRGAILDWDVMADAIARQTAMWAPGERHGYHGTSFGWLVGEPVRRVGGAGSGCPADEGLRSPGCRGVHGNAARTPASDGDTAVGAPRARRAVPTTRRCDAT